MVNPGIDLEELQGSLAGAYDFKLYIKDNCS